VTYNLGIQIEDIDREEELKGRVFELFEKTSNREFKSHVQFIEADSLCDAEDKISEVDPDYWRKKSIRPVTVTYVWDTFTNLYYSYKMAKSVLGLNDLLEE
tara:strand:- start:598 stop:900 length:303 start_codon:yes stop_codon:yes gene_type:complete